MGRKVSQCLRHMEGFYPSIYEPPSGNHTQLPGLMILYDTYQSVIVNCRFSFRQTDVELCRRE